MFRLILAVLATICLAAGHLAPQPEARATAPDQLVPVASQASTVTDVVNAARKGKGRKAIQRSSRLDAVAASHANDMAKRGYFSHVSPNGSKPSDRARRAGYRYCLIAENIANGYPTVAQVMNGWMKSSGHRKNILLPKVTEFGLARAPGDTWVMVLAKPGC